MFLGSVLLPISQLGHPLDFFDFLQFVAMSNVVIGEQAELEKRNRSKIKI